MKKNIFKQLLLGVSVGLMSGWTAQAITLNVQVPEGTKKCYACGSFNGWSAADAPQMEAIGENLFRLDLPETDAAKMAEGYKYLCGQDWLYVEKGANGDEIGNRTIPGNPDIVGSWRSMPEWTVETVELVVNGYPRQVKIYLPEGYDEDETATYPVIYYNCVQQRYNNAGDDNDCGDYFFGPLSWNAHVTMESLRTEGSPAYIMVQVPSFLAENTIVPHPDYAGTGQAERYLNSFKEVVMPYIENNLRVRKGATNTVIVGADFGALFSIYASATHPELFSRCVAMSPMLWINKAEFIEIAKNAGADQRYFISAGSLEPAWMQQDVADLAEAFKNSSATCYNTLYIGGTHDDDSWGSSFASVLQGISTDSAPIVPVMKTIPSLIDETSSLEDAIYTLYAGPDADNLELIGQLTYTEDYHKNNSAETVKAQVITYDIPVAYKSKYYWNIACGPDNTSPWLLETPGDIGFSSKKSDTSWHNIALFEDGSRQNTAAHSKGFRVVTSKESILMTPDSGYSSKATVKFPGEDKTFTIHFGSVNSASDMGALTPSYSVSDSCIEAEVSYDFNLNQVTITETQFGESLDNVKVTSFTAVPATAYAGSDIKVGLCLSNDCDVEITTTHNFNESIGIPIVKDSAGHYSLSLKDVKEGIYTFKVSLTAGENRLDDAAEINVRVIPGAGVDQKEITVNAYKDIDWHTIGRYKANFHTHTSQSFDTKFTTTQVVDKYHAAKYDILALTDHDANPYPWTMFDLWNASAESRDPSAMGMLAIPGCELSKDRRNNWSESTGGEFNHHTDLFTGRKGQEFMSLRESYAYTEALGGLQIINHPGQYWNLATEYKNGEKNSPEWHAENFMLYKSLVGLEAYNQGNRRPNDRILWDQVLTLTMPSRPVWGFSCDDTHTAEQYFRNYQFMLMPELTEDALKEALINGNTIFSYEYTGSGKALCPTIERISVDEDNHLITIDSDTDDIKWISSFHRTGSSASTATNTIVGYGKTFDYTGFQGTYVRALLTNKYGETATQPFGFASAIETGVNMPETVSEKHLSVACNGDEIFVKCHEGLDRISVINTAGMIVKFMQCNGNQEITFSAGDLGKGVYIIVAAGEHAAYTEKFIKE